MAPLLLNVVPAGAPPRRRIKEHAPVHRIPRALFAALLACASLTACSSEESTRYFALDGESCSPDPTTLQPHEEPGVRAGGCFRNGQRVRADDVETPCPPPGCDQNMCCDTPPSESPDAGCDGTYHPPHEPPGEPPPDPPEQDPA